MPVLHKKKLTKTQKNLLGDTLCVILTIDHDGAGKLSDVVNSLCRWIFADKKLLFLFEQNIDIEHMVVKICSESKRFQAIPYLNKNKKQWFIYMVE